MAKNVFVDVAQKAGGLRNLLIINDIDLSYMDTMDTNTTPEQQRMMREMYDRTEGGIIFMSGRSLQGIDETFPGGYAASGEHHSVMRPVHGAAAIALAPSIDTAILGQSARDLIGTQVELVDTPAAVRQAHNTRTVVYAEVKQYALALVHSLGHDGVPHARDVLQKIAADIIRQHNLMDTHKIAVGSDAIEIVPLGLCPQSQAHTTLSRADVTRLLEKGLNKGSAVHNFMSQTPFSNRTPFVVGDSGTDGLAMNEAVQYGGGGIWVENGKDVPQQFQAAVNGFRIENFHRTWDHVSGFLKDCQEKAPTVVLMPNLSNTLLISVDNGGGNAPPELPGGMGHLVPALKKA